MKMMTQMVEAQPGTGSSKISFRTMMATRTRKEKTGHGRSEPGCDGQRYLREN